MERMEDKKILKAAMKTRGMVQVVLAERLGVTQTALSGNMNRNRMSLDVFMDILNELDYDVVVVDRKTGESVWTVAHD